MTCLILMLLLFGFSAFGMQPALRSLGEVGPIYEEGEEIPQEVDTLWDRFNAIKIYHRQVFSVVVDQYDSNIILLRIKALLSEVKTIETRIGTEPMPQERKDYILANLHKLHVKLKYYPL